MSRIEPLPTRLAAAAGLTRGQLRSQAWTTPFHGVRVGSGAAVDLGMSCRALTAVARVPVVVSDRSAAAFSGWWLPPSVADVTEITVAPQHLIERPGVRCHRRVLEPADIRERDGILLTSPVRTLLDLAGQFPLIDLVVVMDAALHMKSCRLDELVGRAQGRGGRGMAMFRGAVALCDGRSESAMETLMRLLIVMSGLPAPTPQVKVYDK